MLVFILLKWLLVSTQSTKVINLIFFWSFAIILIIFFLDGSYPVDLDVAPLGDVATYLVEHGVVKRHRYLPHSRLTERNVPGREGVSRKDWQAHFDA